jgi:hypothetical protein
VWEVNGLKLAHQESGYFRAHKSLEISYTGIEFSRNIWTAIRAFGIDEKSIYFYKTHSGAELDLFWRFGKLLD